MKDYIFSNDFSRNLDAMIYTCGYETCEPSHSYGPVVRSGYLIHYILGGKGIYKAHLSALRGRRISDPSEYAHLLRSGQISSMDLHMDRISGN